MLFKIPYAKIPLWFRFKKGYYKNPQRKNIEELKGVYARIDALEKSEFESRVSVTYEDRYLIFLQWALGMTLLASSWQLIVSYFFTYQTFTVCAATT